MPNVQRIVQLYLIKCVVCVLNYMFDQTKKIFDHFICIGSAFYHFLCSCLVLTLFFIVLSMFCVEKQMSEFLATHFGYSRE